MHSRRPVSCLLCIPHWRSAVSSGLRRIPEGLAGVANIPNRRVSKQVDADRADRRFTMESQTWIKRKLVIVLRCERCGGYVGLRGFAVLEKPFRCKKCGRQGNIEVVRRQLRPGDLAVFCGGR